MQYKLEYSYRGLTITSVANTPEEIGEFGGVCLSAVQDFSSRGLFYNGTEMKSGGYQPRTLTPTPKPKPSAPLASDKQKNLLRQLHVEFDENITKDEASHLIDITKGK